MSRALIFAVAGLCGSAAFLWSLFARAPRPDEPVLYAPGGPPAHARNYGAMRFAPPRDRRSLEAWVRDNDSDFASWFDLAERRHAAGDEPASMAAWKRVADLAGETVRAEAMRARAWFALARARSALGEPEAARAAWAEAERRFTAMAGSGRADMMALSQLGWSRRALGDEIGARAAWTKGESLLMEQDSADPTVLYNLACFRALLGRPIEALDTLARAVDHGYTDAEWAEHDEDLLPIAHDPRFEALAARMREVAAKP